MRSDGNYCDYCGELLRSAAAPHLRRRFPLRRKRKLLIGAVVLAVILGVVVLVGEPWYEPLAPRPDEIIMPMEALYEWGLDASSVEDRLRRGDYHVSLVRLSTGHLYEDAGGLPFPDVAFLVTFDFPIRKARYKDTGQPYKIFDGYVDEKWSRFWVAASADMAHLRTRSEYPEGQHWHQLAVEIEVLDPNRLLVSPQGIPEECCLTLVINSPPAFLHAYYDKITREAYYYSLGYSVIISPGIANPEPMTEERYA